MKLLHNLSGSPEVSLLVLAMTICMQYIVHLQIAPDEAYQADVSMDFHTRLYRTASQGKILCQSQAQSLFSLPQNRLTSSSDFALSRSSSVQRSFFCGDVIAHVMGTAPDVVNSHQPYNIRGPLSDPAVSNRLMVKGTLPNYFSWTPSLLASWQKQLIVIPGLEDSGRYTFCITSIIEQYSQDTTEIICTIVQKWIQGKEKLPIEWSTLVRVLKDIGLHILADEMEQNLKDQYWLHVGTKGEAICMCSGVMAYTSSHIITGLWHTSSQVQGLPQDSYFPADIPDKVEVKHKDVQTELTVEIKNQLVQTETITLEQGTLN